MDIAGVLHDHGLLTATQLELVRQEANGVRADQLAVELGYVDEAVALRTIGDEIGLPFMDLRDFDVDRQVLAKFPTTPIYRHSLLPLHERDGRVVVATSDPFDLEPLDELGALSGVRIVPALAPRNEIVRLIKDNLGVGGDTVNKLVAQTSDEVELLDSIDDDLGELAEQAQEASVIRLVNELLVEALEQQASDIHVEPSERGLRVRFRVDGILRVQPIPPEINQFVQAIVTRLKIMARLNIAEKRRPQDGRIQLRVSGREIDVRVSIIPMLHGEGIVMRLLDKERMVFELDNVGMPTEVLEPFRELISLPHGIVLVTGPTGSGKTSTLYSALTAIKSPATKIITVEDPVEYQTEGISQIQVQSKVGLTFAAGLRSILRHDPDVVLIGEIRDGETAQSAIQASLTGHLVFSTLHTNDAPGAITRLVDMGVEPYLVASTVEAALAQRLVRVLCKSCKEPYQPNPDDLPPDFPKEALANSDVYRPVGCRACRDVGYAGRTGVFELMRMDTDLRRMTVEQVGTDVLARHARDHGMLTLRESGWGKVLDGTTSIDEVLRITKGDYVG